MSAKHSTKANATSAPPPPMPARSDVAVRVKTRATGVKRVVCGVIFGNEYKRLLLDERGSAYKAIARDPALVMEHLPHTPLAADEAAADTLPGKEAP